MHMLYLYLWINSILIVDAFEWAWDKNYEDFVFI